MKLKEKVTLIHYEVTNRCYYHELMHFDCITQDILKVVTAYCITMLAKSRYLATAERRSDRLFADCKLQLNGGEWLTEPDEIVQALFITPVQSLTMDLTCDGFCGDFLAKVPKLDGTGEKELYISVPEAPWTGCGLYDYLLGVRDTCDFTYKMVCDWTDCGDYGFYKIENGQDVDIRSAMTQDVLPLAAEGMWTSCKALSLRVEFDYKKHPEILKKLHALAMRSLPGNAQDHCEDCWREDPELIVPPTRWSVQSLHRVQKFLQAVNEIIAPLEDAKLCWPRTCTPAHDLWIDFDHFAVARWTGESGAFELRGAVL